MGVEDQLARGFEALEEGRFEEALAVAARLRKKRYTGAFELEASVHRELGDLERAVAVLREGLDLGPQVWLNWMLLGSTLSDLERWDEAEAAYLRGRSCPDADPDWVDLNRAVLAHRQGDLARALELCPRNPGDAELAERAAVSRSTWLLEAERFAEAEAEVLPALGHGDWEAESLGRLWMVLADCRSRQPGRHPEALDAVRRSLAAHPAMGSGTWLETVLARLLSPPWTLRRFKLQVQGVWEGGEHDGFHFLRFHLVGATGLEEATARARDFEDPRGRGEFRVEEATDLGPLPEEFAGVLGSTGRIFFRSEED